MRPNVVLRDIAPEDEEFLHRLYASTREAELAQTGWDDEQKTAFLRMQFDAQHRYYVEQFSGASFQIVLLDGQPIGRLYVDRREDEIRIIDIALLAAQRNCGIGSGLMGELIAEAEEAGLPLRIHVERSSQALRLYRRLGFRDVGDTGVYLLMEWSP